MDRLLIPTFFCPKAWAGMAGDETTRFCSYCHKHVHNLDALSVSERLALLSSPAASICARYKIAIRRPKPGRKESYARHLAKYGAAVALAGSAMVVLWEMHERAHRAFNPPARYRVVSPGITCGGWPEMPDDYYTEIEVTTVGIVAIIPAPPCEPMHSPGLAQSDFVDVHLEPTQIKTLLESVPAPSFPTLPLPDKAKKKINFPRG